MTLSTGRQAVIGATWLTAGGYLSFILNFAANLVLVRLLFPHDFGIFALAIALVEVFSIAAGFAFSQGIIQMPEAPSVEDTAYRMTLWLCGILLGVGTGAAALSAALRGSAFGILLFVIFTVRVLTTLCYVYSAQLERAFRYRSLSGVRLASTVLGVLVALALAASGAGVWSLVGREVSVIGLTFLGLRAVTRWRYGGGYEPDTARRLFGFGMRLFATRALEIVNFRSDALLLGWLAGTVALGFYDRARFLGELGHYAVSFAAVQVAFPLYARFKTERGSLNDAYRVIHYFLIRAMMPIALVMIVMPEALVQLILGARWQSSVPVLRWLAAFAFLLPLVDNTKVLLTGIGALGDALRIRVVQVIVTLPALFILIPRWGTVGAAAGIALGSLAAALAAYTALRRHLTDLAVRMYIVPAVAALLGVAVGAWSLHAWLGAWPASWASAAALTTALVMYLGVLAALEYPELQRNLRIIWPISEAQMEKAS